MRHYGFTKVLGFFCVLGGLTGVASATPMNAICSPDQTTCYIQENVLLQMPFLIISGDVVLLDNIANQNSVSDVFRLYNDIADTGQGTGLGSLVELFSADDQPVPAPSTYSANVAFIQEAATGPTVFNSNGTTYILGAPEPATFGMFGIVLALAGGWSRMRRRRA